MKKQWAIFKEKRKNQFDIIDAQNLKTNIVLGIPFWIASILTGIVAVGYTKLFTYTEVLLQHVLKNEFRLIFILSPVCFLISWFLVKRFAPNAKGSGIPQIMASIELAAPKYEQKIPALLNLKIAFIKIVSSLFLLLGGGAIGREGPTIQISGSIFRWVYRWVPSTWQKLSQKNFIITGAAAGLAAAFNTPLGGIVFAIEELARVHISVFRTTLFTAVIIAGLVAQGFLGPYLYLGYPDIKQSGGIVFIGVFLVAIATGLAGSIMSKLILKLMRWKKQFSTTQTIIFIIGAGLFVANISYFFNADILGSGKHLMIEDLFDQNKHRGLVTAIMRIIGPIISFNVGGSGGIFAPSLAAGATIGSFLSWTLGFIGANAHIIILSGMVGFLTGVTRTPFTSAILVLEMTDRHGAIFHLMLAALVSNLVALIIDKRSLYEHLKNEYL
ncbi:MAG: chloride channel protein [Bacteroidetes bacterium]|nr:chloride channel protein [Bacteroidota bacterium]